MPIHLNAARSFAWRAYWRSPKVLVPLCLSLFIDVLVWLLPYWQLSFDSDFLTIRYSIYVGTNWLAAKYFIFLPAVICLIFIIVNTFISYTVGKISLILRSIILWQTVIICLAFCWLEILLIVFNS
ncbi:MAG: hypothetical protein WC575_00255 [Patescibacteria group bacterium]